MNIQEKINRLGASYSARSSKNNEDQASQLNQRTYSCQVEQDYEKSKQQLSEEDSKLIAELHEEFKDYLQIYSVWNICKKFSFDPKICKSHIKVQHARFIENLENEYKFKSLKNDSALQENKSSTQSRDNYNSNNFHNNRNDGRKSIPQKFQNNSKRNQPQKENLEGEFSPRVEEQSVNQNSKNQQSFKYQRNSYSKQNNNQNYKHEQSYHYNKKQFKQNFQYVRKSNQLPSDSQQTTLEQLKQSVVQSSAPLALNEQSLQTDSIIEVPNSQISQSEDGSNQQENIQEQSESTNNSNSLSQGYYLENEGSLQGGESSVELVQPKQKNSESSSPEMVHQTEVESSEQQVQSFPDKIQSDIILPTNQQEIVQSMVVCPEKDEEQNQKNEQISSGAQATISSSEKENDPGKKIVMSIDNEFSNSNLNVNQEEKKSQEKQVQVKKQSDNEWDVSDLSVSSNSQISNNQFNQQPSQQLPLQQQFYPPPNQNVNAQQSNQCGQQPGFYLCYIPYPQMTQQQVISTNQDFLVPSNSYPPPSMPFQFPPQSYPFYFNQWGQPLQQTGIPGENQLENAFPFFPMIPTYYPQPPTQHN